MSQKWYSSSAREGVHTVHLWLLTLDKICTGDLPFLEKEIKEHIRNQNKKVNFNLAANKKRE
ncbi:hypothetical protein QP615_02825 [Providencia rettgeri]|nr:hypothetical protein [Providencia rettgeri]MDK7743721.1 hypothetical protein [Providencia rettgeri]MDK7756563.1 hypothetical protein [Providencia rettgeri]